MQGLRANYYKNTDKNLHNSKKSIIFAADF